MSITREEFEKLPLKTLHGEYVRKLREIGEKLGFDTADRKTLLGVLDCVWRLKGNIRLPQIEDNLPIVAFEVICSEEQKAIRGSTLNLIAAKPSLAVFVLVKEGILQKRTDTTPEQWLRRIETYVDKIKQSFSGILRIAIWNEEDVDKLYRTKVHKAQPAPTETAKVKVNKAPSDEQMLAALQELYAETGKAQGSRHISDKLGIADPDFGRGAVRAAMKRLIAAGKAEGVKGEGRFAVLYKPKE